MIFDDLGNQARKKKLTCLCRLAGSDTTAISLRAIVYYLVRDRNVYIKAQGEVDQADHDGKLSPYITYAECLELPYL